MTDASALALGQRWVAAKGGWAPGMAPLQGEWWTKGSPAPRVDRVVDGVPLYVCDYHGGERRPLPDGDVPDFRDAATVGAALGILREKWRGTIWLAGRFVRPGRIAWFAVGMCGADDLRVNGTEGFDSEAEALVAAMEAAP